MYSNRNNNSGNFFNQSNNNNYTNHFNSRNQNQQPDNNLLQMNNNQQPIDTIQCIEFNPQDQLIFAAGSFDGCVHIYGVNTQGPNPLLQRASQINLGDPVLSVAWQANEIVVAGCSSGQVYACQIPIGQNQAAQKVQIAQHEGPVIGVFIIPPTNNSPLYTLVISMDGAVALWKQNDTEPSIYVRITAQILCCDYKNNMLALGLSGQLQIVEILEKVFKFGDKLKDKSILDTPLVSVSLKNDGDVLIFGGTDGRIIQSLIRPEGNAMKCDNKLLFKAHKQEINDKTVVFQCNALSIANMSKPYDHIFCTGGGEGTLNIWDYVTKDKTKEWHHDLAVTCAKFNHTGSLLAYSIGYDWSEGICGLDKLKRGPEIYVRVITETDLKDQKNSNARRY